jgi:enediyne polyketide synthase
MFQKPSAWLPKGFMTQIAVIGMACRYADVRSPVQLWENALAQRQAFRRIPPVRLNLADYSHELQNNDDYITPTMAAVLDDYEFDRARFHVSQGTFATTDLTHWLALDVAAQALADAKLIHATAEQRERTSVYVGNSLTGEFSRANLMRLRWPYVRRVLAAAFQENKNCRPEGMQDQDEDLQDLVGRIEALYKAPFPATNEESLAGGLSNTIAGRICNYFDFKGGGYTVDGACASSLLAITTACSALQSGDVDIAIAGGVDLSLDPFELAGFSSLGALAKDKMRVFDTASSGFWPGEGCGMVVLMRYEDALARHHSPYAVIRGWGISSDGNGGITRPEVAGQMLALRRAYEKSGYGIDSVAYFEGHGTGTSIGDATELQALSQAINQTHSNRRLAALGSIKANIGHTKAAAGVAGLIKATMAVHARILPPVTGCDHPHAELTSDDAKLRVLRKAELWPHGVPARAGVNGFGFGGINVHVTLEAADNVARKSFIPAEIEQFSSAQDCELFIFAAASASELSEQLAEVLRFAEEISYSELADLSISLAEKADADATGNFVRAACVASSPDELVSGIEKLLACCETGSDQQMDVPSGIFFSQFSSPPKIGFLFPGQASPVYIDGGIWSRRFPALHDLYANARLPQQPTTHTQTAQPCIAAASLAGLNVLRSFDIEGTVGVGHSLGEITALHWAGTCSEEELMRIVHARGRVMAEAGDPLGAMASIRASHGDVMKRLNGDGLVVAACNAPMQTVVSGEAGAVKRFTEKLSSHGISSTMLPVSHAFHSPLVAGVATAFAEHLASCQFADLSRRVVSTVTAVALAPSLDLRSLLSEQITKPVLFEDALKIAVAETDLFLEVGPGAVLSGIVAECTEKPAIALDAGSESLRGLFSAVGAAFACGGDVRLSQLYKKRFGRPIDIKKKHSFLANPCERVPQSISPKWPATVPKPATPHPAVGVENSALATLLCLVAQRTQLPLDAIKPEQQFLTDLHLNSITISQIVLEAASQLSLPAPATPAEFTNATLAETAEVLEGLRSQARETPSEKYPAGVDSWIRTFGIELVKKPLRRIPVGTHGNWEVTGLAGSRLRDRLQEEFRFVAGGGMVCCVPDELNEKTTIFLVQSAQAALQQKLSQIVFVQHRGGAGAIARTLYLENPDIKVAVVNVPPEHPDAAKWAAAEASANQGFIEAYYDDAGMRREPRLKLLRPETNVNKSALGCDDVLLVTGGGKGIAAESALHLALMAGCRLALLGRSDPARDEELKHNLLRFAEAGVRFSYFMADVTDRNAVENAVEKIQSELGPVTAILHGAGINNPKRLEEITQTDLNQILAPKVDGLRNLLESISPSSLRLLVTFGSIIARTGLHGEAHYGLANEWLNLVAERWQKTHAHCRCLNLDWSVWAGIGMGQRLGVLDSLVRQGITPLPIGDAIEHLKAILAWEQAPYSSIITGRFGNLPTLKFDKPGLPLMRFLEHARVYHPGIELITDAKLSADTDPYVTEHAFQGEQLLPAVMGMEAMAQVAKALEQSELLPKFRNLRFEHPIVIPRNKSVTIRIATLRRQPGVIAAVIRCSSTSFKIDHFSGECIFEEKQPAPDQPVVPQTAHQPLALDPKHALYGRILFHHGRFARIESYELLHSDRSIASLNAPSPSPWFARHLPQELVMGDAASRDAALHSIQACIPHKTILPVGIDRVTSNSDWTRSTARVHAIERIANGDNFIYDLRIEDGNGRVCEQWEGLHLRAVSEIETKEAWPLPLLVPYLERKVGQILLHCEIKIALINSPKEHQKDAIGISIREMFGADAMLTHRPDGKPEITSASITDPHVSISHTADITLLFSASKNTGCDVEKITRRDSACWKKLLGPEDFALARLLSGESKIPFDDAATQIWTLKEILRKAGACFGQPLSLNSYSADSWASFSAGKFIATTFRTHIQDSDSGFAFGFVLQGKS